MKRKAYLLLELLIALSLLVLCAIPLVRNPLFLARKEIATFEKIEMERLAELAFAELLEKLYQNEIPLKLFEETNMPKDPYQRDVASVDLPGILNKKFTREFFLWMPARKLGTDQNEFGLLHIKIKLSPFGKNKDATRNFSYRVFIEIKKNNTKTEGKVL
jgi:hypothetical protein